METGIAIAGGCVPKFAAIGVLRALDEEGITITHIGGTSAGSIVAALYAYGYTSQQIEDAVSTMGKHHMDVNWSGIIRRFCFFRRKLDGGVKGDKLQSLLNRMTHDDLFSACQIPCAVAATDIRKKEPVVIASEEVAGYTTITNMPMDQAVRASSSIPVLYKPVRWGDHILVDGGLMRNCPVDVVKNLGAKHILAIDPLSTFEEREPFEDMSTILNQSMTILLEEQMKEEQDSADICLKPNLGDVGLFDYDKISDCIEVGYQYTKEHIKDILTSLMK
ncbi:patatin-like phospholipase family protein [Salinibacillus xinjiangensis]|nr:patatin-like phospholipase family protein [Salinibacillus xinjiangensis]